MSVHTQWHIIVRKIIMQYALRILHFNLLIYHLFLDVGGSEGT